jgi:hypothetical protein
VPDAPPAQPIDFGMTDLEEKLRGPGGKAARAALISRLEQLGSEFAAKLKSGLTPADYAKADAIAKALAAAREIVIAFPEVAQS